MEDKETNVLNSLYNEDGTIKAPYADPNDSGKFATSASSEHVGVGQDDINSFLGSGMDAAEGVKYKWDKQAEERAEMSYKKNVLDAKANYLTNRQELESQGQQAQQQSDMQKYSQNQSVDKVGWTGGYVLDTERQMNYLKETIKAQMYGQMELQKYGYDTSLAAARLAYDTDKYDLALQYYQQAIQNAVTEAAQNGIYIAPEVREHGNNYKIASDILNDPNATPEEKELAAQRITSITNWYKDFGISPAGVKTISRLTTDSQTAINNQTQIKTMYEMYAIDPKNNYKIDSDSFGKIGKDGKIIINKDDYGVMTPEIIDFKGMDANELLEYGATHDIAKQQIYGYFDSKVSEDINNYLDTVKEVNGETTTYNVNADSLKQYLEDRGLKDLRAIYTEAKNSETYKTLLNDWIFETKAGNMPVYFTVNESGDIEVNINLKDDSSTVNTETGEGSVDASTGNVVTSDWYYDATGKTRIAYNYTDTNDLYNKLNDNGIQTGQKIIIDMNEDKSKWGDKIDQTHFDSDTSKGKAGPYIEKIQADAKAGKIKLGQYVQLNYGAQSGGANYTYVYIGNGKFAKCIIEPKNDGHRDRLAEQFYVPDGYRLEKPVARDYSDKYQIYKK